MQINYNSLTAKLYRWFYATSKMPSNLCPYFWKLVIATIFAVPTAIITTPAVLINRDREFEIAERYAFGLMTWLGLVFGACVLSTVSLFWIVAAKDSLLDIMNHIGIFVLVLTIGFGSIIGIVFSIKFLVDRRREANAPRVWDDSNYEWVPNPNYKKPAPAIAAEFIKAKYKKYCPKIDWN